MPVHDWPRVNDGTFHDFHYSWVLEIKRALTRGLLPPGYYVMAEQFGGDVGAPDVLTLQNVHVDPDSENALVGTTTLADALPKVQGRSTIERDTYTRSQRSLGIRHVSDDRIVAMIEVLSPGNKSSRHAIRSFTDKEIAALDGGVNLLLVDVHPPGPHDPQGIHGLVLSEIGTEEYVLPNENARTTIAYVGGSVIEGFFEHFAIGDSVPTMPLFLTRENYVNVPLEDAYLAAFEDVPPQYREVLSTSE